MAELSHGRIKSFFLTKKFQVAELSHGRIKSFSCKKIQCQLSGFDKIALLIGGRNE